MGCLQSARISRFCRHKSSTVPPASAFTPTQFSFLLPAARIPFSFFSTSPFSYFYNPSIMQIIVLAALASLAAAAPSKWSKRQQDCPLQDLSGLSVVASADPTGKTRWDVFTVSSGLIQQGDVAWFVNDQPNGNELIGVSGSELLASDTAAEFQVVCGGGCNAFASGNDLAGNGCTFQLTDGSGNGTGQCMTFEAANSVAQLQDCEDGNAGQSFGIFSA
ncbi:hypothetical protein HMN09_01335800 [Mycena chlorophos]|uniref:Uncharacterized protein n=1 Tax=Mycena chlorophos TaxID=658473 RepID=A0A8H6S031_MYCCL|nr:hypothetical protein HMN09_01335800 [Mycena chlorophos]